MEALNELINLVTKKRIKKVELFDENSRNKLSNYYKLFEGIHLEKYKTDAEAAQDIYQCEPSEKKYLILKTRLKQKLLNTLFFLEPESKNYSATKAAQYECNKTLFYAKVLLLNNSKRIAIPSLEKTLKKAQEFYLTEIELEAARLLRQHTSNAGPYKDFLSYRDLVDETEKKWHVENLAECYLQESLALFNKSKSNRDKARQLSYTQYTELESYLEHFNSPTLWMNFYNLKALHFQLSDNYRETIEVIKVAEQYMADHPLFFTKSDLAKMAIKKMNCYLHLRDFEGGEEALQNSLPYFTKGGINWTNLHEYYFLLAMHTEQYTKAAEIFQKVVMQPKFRTLAKARKDRWKVFQAYLHFIYKDAGIKEIRPLTQNSKTGFKLNEFLTEVPGFSKKQRGIIVAKLLVQVLFHLEKMNIDQVKKCTEMIARYSRRYPKKDINYRSECIILLLMNMMQEEFKFYQTRKLSEKHFDDMSQTLMQYNGGNKGLEVLPYEVMWNIVLEKLKSYKYG